MDNSSMDKKNGPPKSKTMELKLNSLLEVTKAINNNFTTGQLLDIFESVLRNQLNIGKLLLFNYDKGWNCLLKYGVDDEFYRIDVEKELIPITEISPLETANKELKRTFDIVIPVFHKNEPLAYVLVGDLSEEKLEISPTIKHLPFIQTLTNIIIVAIENKKLVKENIRQAALKRELELASEMQSMLFPKKLPDNKQLQVDALYLPHQQVGGDYYDFIRINNDEVAFCMADVSGKGVAAALLASNFQANLRILLKQTVSLTALVSELNTKVLENANGEKFITLFIAIYNFATRQLKYVNAGHNPPLLVNNGKIATLEKGCTVLGIFEQLTGVKEGEVLINTPATIVCYTDGVVEAENEIGKDFGIESLIQLIEKEPDLVMADLNKRILDEVNLHKGEMPYTDDIALFSCRFF